MLKAHSFSKRNKIIILLILFCSLFLPYAYFTYFKNHSAVIESGYENIESLSTVSRSDYEDIESLVTSYLELLDEHRIDEAIELLYFREENLYRTEFIRDDYTTWPPKIKGFKLYAIKQINENLYRIKSAYTNRSKDIDWQPYIIHINDNWKIILNSNNIPDEWLDGVIVGEDMRPEHLPEQGLQIIEYSISDK